MKGCEGKVMIVDERETDNRLGWYFCILLHIHLHVHTCILVVRAKREITVTKRKGMATTRQLAGAQQACSGW